MDFRSCLYSLEEMRTKRDESVRKKRREVPGGLSGYKRTLT